MARLFHTADWHVGKRLGRLDRSDDHRVALGEIVSQAEAAKPDVILHAGDVFDSQRPSPEDQRLAFRALAQLGEIAPTIVVAGNHDSATAFEGLGALLETSARVTLLARAQHPSKRPIITIPTADRNRLRIAAVPWISPGRLVDFFDGEHTVSSYQDGVRTVNAAMADALIEGYDPAKDVLLYLAHEHLNGAVMSGSERALHVGETYQSEASALPQVAYAALGHIHKPQQIENSPAVYAGSPFQLDFGEAGEQKSSVLVDVQPGRPAQIQRLPLTEARALVKLTGTFEQIATAQIPGKAILRATVKADTANPHLTDELAVRLPDVTIESVEQHLPSNARALTEKDAAPEDREPTVEEMFTEHLSAVGTKDPEVPPERVVALFEELTGLRHHADGDAAGQMPLELIKVLGLDPPSAPAQSSVTLFDPAVEVDEIAEIQAERGAAA